MGKNPCSRKGTTVAWLVAICPDRTRLIVRSAGTRRIPAPRVVAVTLRPLCDTKQDALTEVVERARYQTFNFNGRGVCKAVSSNSAEIAASSSAVYERHFGHSPRTLRPSARLKW